MICHFGTYLLISFAKTFNSKRKQRIILLLYACCFRSIFVNITRRMSTSSPTDRRLLLEWAVQQLLPINRSILRKLSPSASICTAELQAICDALVIISECQANNFSIFSESLSALQAIEIYNNHHPIKMEIITWLVRLHERHKRITICWVPAHVNINGNEQADRCARDAATSDRRIQSIQLPHRDYYNLIKSKMKEKWALKWSSLRNNKLRSLKDNIKPWPSSMRRNRPEEILLCRLRIGYTRLMHRHLMETQYKNQHYPNSRNLNAKEALKYILAEHENVSFNMNTLMIYLRSCEIVDKI